MYIADDAEFVFAAFGSASGARIVVSRRREAARRIAATAWVAAAALVIVTAMPASTQTLARAELLAALRAGGYVIYFRQADTDHSRQDQRPVNLDDCATQRVLSEKGRQNSRAIGEAIRALDVPIGAVLASPLCRTVETAELAFGSTEKSMATRDGGPDPVGSPGRYAALRALLSTVPRAGKNMAIVGHGYPYYSLIGKGQMLEEGEAAIVRPHGTSFEEVARLGLKEWRELEGLPR
jgi:Histidine phosphatase superfamily (branch 1)